MSLPDLFFMRAVVRNDRRPEEARYCLISTTSVHSPGNGTVWKTKVVEGSKHLVTGATLRHDGIETPPVKVWHERDTSLHASGVFYYEVRMWRTQNYLVLPGQGQIWEYKMTHANKALPSVYNHVGNCKDHCKKWHFTLSDVAAAPMVSIQGPPALLRPPPTVVNTVVVNKIPTHVLHAFIEGAIRNKEECPVSMEKLTKNNVGCLPCGHLFEKTSLRRAVETGKACPTCRAKAGVDDIQLW